MTRPTVSYRLGTPGRLTELSGVEIGAEPTVTDARFGGEHISITGNQTVDVLGRRRVWSLKWNYLSDAELAWLQYCDRCDEELWFLDPYEDNLLPVRMPAGGAATAVFAPSGLGRLRSLSALWESSRVPAVALTYAAAYVTGTAGTASLVMYGYDATGAKIQTGTAGAAVTLTTTPQRITANITPAANVVTVSVAVSPSASANYGDLIVSLKDPTAYALPGGSARVTAKLGDLQHYLSSHSASLVVREV